MMMIIIIQFIFYFHILLFVLLLFHILLFVSQGQAKTGRRAQTYIQQLCADTGCSPEDLPKAMDDREELEERVRNICADSTT